MGCDIQMYAETFNKENNRYERSKVEIDVNRSYARFGWFADVRNYAAVKAISKPRGLPDDISEDVNIYYDEYVHSASWLTIEELKAVDYQQIVEDRRVSRDGNGGCTSEAGEGEKMTLEEFLGSEFIKLIKILDKAQVTRVVFWFDD